MFLLVNIAGGVALILFGVRFRLVTTTHWLRDNHFKRLRQGQSQSFESSAVRLDILTHLKRINSCVTHVAYAIVQNDGRVD